MSKAAVLHSRQDNSIIGAVATVWKTAYTQFKVSRPDRHKGAVVRETWVSTNFDIHSPVAER